MEVYKFLFHLKHNWTRLAIHLGYSDTEIECIVKAEENDIHNQIQLFLRVWWMPDCGEKTHVFLQQGRCVFEWSLSDIFINVLCSVIQEKLQLPVKVCLQYRTTNIRDHDAIQLNA